MNHYLNIMVRKQYLSRDAQHLFSFEFRRELGGIIAIYCPRHPDYGGQDSDPRKTHIFDSGRICLVTGQEPTTQQRAEDLAAKWAEYFVEYRRTGIAQG